MAWLSYWDIFGILLVTLYFVLSFLLPKRNNSDKRQRKASNYEENKNNTSNNLNTEYIKATDKTLFYDGEQIDDIESRKSSSNHDGGQGLSTQQNVETGSHQSVISPSINQEVGCFANDNLVAQEDAVNEPLQYNLLHETSSDENLTELTHDSPASKQAEESAQCSSKSDSCGIDHDDIYLKKNYHDERPSKYLYKDFQNGDKGSLPKGDAIKAKISNSSDKVCENICSREIDSVQSENFSSESQLSFQLIDSDRMDPAHEIPANLPNNNNLQKFADGLATSTIETAVDKSISLNNFAENLSDKIFWSSAEDVISEVHANIEKQCEDIKPVKLQSLSNNVASEVVNEAVGEAALLEECMKDEEPEPSLPKVKPHLGYVVENVVNTAICEAALRLKQSEDESHGTEDVDDNLHESERSDMTAPQEQPLAMTISNEGEEITNYISAGQIAEHQLKPDNTCESTFIESNDRENTIKVPSSFTEENNKFSVCDKEHKSLEYDTNYSESQYQNDKASYELTLQNKHFTSSKPEISQLECSQEVYPTIGIPNFEKCLQDEVVQDQDYPLNDNLRSSFPLETQETTLPDIDVNKAIQKEQHYSYGKELLDKDVDQDIQNSEQYSGRNELLDKDVDQDIQNSDRNELLDNDEAEEREPLNILAENEQLEESNKQFEQDSTNLTDAELINEKNDRDFEDQSSSMLCEDIRQDELSKEYQEQTIEDKCLLTEEIIDANNSVPEIQLSHDPEESGSPVSPPEYLSSAVTLREKTDDSKETFWRRSLILDLEDDFEPEEGSLSSPSSPGSPKTFEQRILSQESEELTDSEEDDIIDYDADSKLGAMGGNVAKQPVDDQEYDFNDYGSDDDDDAFDPVLTVDGLCISKQTERRSKGKENLKSVGSHYNRAIVVDNGCGYIKLGYAGDRVPRVNQQAISGIPSRYSVQITGLGTNLRDFKKFGSDAVAKAGVMHLSHPMKSGMIENWTDVEDIWEHMLFDELGAEIGDNPIIMSEISQNNKKNRERITEILFEHLNVPAMFLADQLPLSIYASGLTSGVCLSSGFSCSQAAVVYEGHTLSYTLQHLDIGGGHLTENLKLLLRDNRGHNFNTSSGWQIVNDIKENIAFVAKDFESEVKNFKTNDALTKYYTLPDGQVIDVGYECMSCVEPLFQPDELLTADATTASQSPVHQLVHNAIKRCDNDLQNICLNHVILSGGTTLLNGFIGRLQHELHLINSKIRKLRAPEHRRYSPWIGGSILGSLPVFEEQYVTMDEYGDSGPRIVHKKCF